LRHFLSNGIDIAYFDQGEGEAILLIHGFASNTAVNWGTTGWIDTLARAGRRVLSIDIRGHGESAKLRDPALYAGSAMAGDAAHLLDHLGIPRADVMGYSMGARIAAFLALEYPAKVRSAILGGLGMGLVEGIGGEDAIIRALEARSLDEVTDETGRAYRKFAEQTGSDLPALAACMRSARETIAPERLAEIRAPVLVAVGAKDRVAGSGAGLARLIPGAEFLEIPNRDHMLATGDKAYKQGVLDFLKRRP
jgi:pimeloyl-ACP methyl ester carboxylesterase